MSFDIVSNYIQGRMKLLGYARSEEPFDFKNAPATEYGTTFILYPVGGELTEDGDYLSTKMYDSQVWELRLAFDKSDMNDVITRDMALRRIETIIKDLDDPNKWLGTLRYLRYKAWNIEELENYYLITIELMVQDEINY